MNCCKSQGFGALERQPRIRAWTMWPRASPSWMPCCPAAVGRPAPSPKCCTTSPGSASCACLFRPWPDSVKPGAGSPLIAPPHIPYAPALAAHGVNLSRILLVHPRKDKDALWALEQALRSGTCAAVIAWPGKVDNPGLRRLQLAAERGRTWGVLFRQAREAETASPAHLRFHLSKEDSALSLELLKCRGGKAHRRIRIDLTRADTPTPVPQEPRPAHGPRLAAPGCSPYRPSFPACAAPIGHTGHALSDLTDGPPASPAREAQRPSSRAGWVLPGTPRESILFVQKISILNKRLPRIFHLKQQTGLSVKYPRWTLHALFPIDGLPHALARHSFPSAPPGGLFPKP